MTAIGPARLRAGDGYASFGRGVALSLRRVDALGQDTAIRGGRVDLAHGGGRLTLLGGVTNPQGFDPIELRAVAEVRDPVAGAELSLPVPGGKLAPYGLYLMAADAAADGDDLSWRIGGASAELELLGTRLTVDAAAGRRAGNSLAGDETGRAAYLAVQRAFGPVTLLADGKLYRHWQIGRGDRQLLYHEPPTLEREDQEVPGNEDAAGGRLLAEWRIRRRTTVSANGMAYRYTLDGSNPLDGATAAHGYAAIEQRWTGGASAALASGYRREQQADGDLRLWLWHADADIALPLAHGFALTGKWNHREELKVTFDDQRFRRGLLVIGGARRNLGTLSLLYGYSTEVGSAPTHYPGVEALVQLPRGSQLRLFAGRLTGGRICVSGSCRDVPPFEGARLDLMLRL